MGLRKKEEKNGKMSVIPIMLYQSMKPRAVFSQNHEHEAHLKYFVPSDLNFDSSENILCFILKATSRIPVVIVRF